MLKKMLYRKIIVASSLLLAISLLYLIPTDKIEIENKLEYIDNTNKSVVYLLDNNDYVSMVNVSIKSNDTINSIKELVNYMIIDNQLLPEYFKGLLPKNTRIIDLCIDNKTLKINFSKEFYNVSKNNEEKLIEALIYTLTSIDNIDKLDIYIDGIKFNKLPFSNKGLPNLLDKSYGINKKYEMSSLSDIDSYTIYYTSTNNDNTYYVPVTKYINNSNQDKIKVIIDELASSIIYETNLTSFLDSNVKLLNYEIIDKTIKLDFNDLILSSITDNVILEEVMYTIGLSIQSEFDINQVVFRVNNQVISTLNLE